MVIIIHLVEEAMIILKWPLGNRNASEWRCGVCHEKAPMSDSKRPNVKDSLKKAHSLRQTKRAEPQTTQRFTSMAFL